MHTDTPFKTGQSLENWRPEPSRRFCVAPMLDWTDRHCRYFHRLFTRQALLYTEMVTTGALIHGDDRGRFLDFNPEEQPLALQLGGSDPEALARCARWAEDWGYAEVNLNLGCPSDRVQNGRFGACLMAEPERVAEAVTAMKAATRLPVTVKHRLGIDDLDSYDFLCNFVGTVAAGGCGTFIVHARKAILSGLSARANREIPPLMPERVMRLKADFPDLEIVINGGIQTLDEAEGLLEHLDGVMLGRAAYQNPQLLAAVDRRLFATTAEDTPLEKVIEGLLDYVQNQQQQGARLGWIARHLPGLFQGCPGARRFRRYLSEEAFRPGADWQVLQAAIAQVASAPIIDPAGQ